MGQCLATVYDVGPTLIHHWVKVSSLLDCLRKACLNSYCWLSWVSLVSPVSVFPYYYVALTNKSVESWEGSPTSFAGVRAVSSGDSGFYLDAYLPKNTRLRAIVGLMLDQWRIRCTNIRWMYMNE